MGYHDYRIGKISKEIFQPVDGLDIQMVRRLIQEQDIRASEKRLRQKHAHLLLRGQLRHRQRMLFIRDAKAIQQSCRLRLGLPSVQLRELRLQFRDLHAVRIRKIRLRIKRFLLIHDLDQTLMPHEHRAKHLIFIIGIVILLQDRDALPRRDLDTALGRFQLPRQQAQQRGFPRPVRADDAVAVARRKFQIDILEQYPLAKLQGQAACCDHSSTSSPRNFSSTSSFFIFSM